MSDCGVYVLYSGSVPVYVGSSVRMGRRVAFHNHRNKFDRAEFHQFPENELTDREQEFIDRLRPSLNRARAYRRELTLPQSAFTIAVNLLPDDDSLLKRAKAAFEARTGVTIPVTQAIRLAIKALAEKEGV